MTNNRPVKKLGEICNFINGKAFKPEERSTSGIPIIRIQNLNKVNSHFNYCNFSVPEKIQINNGDLLVSWSGTPGTSFGAYIRNGPKGVLNQHIFKTEIDEKVVDKYYLRLAIENILEEMIAEAHGGAGLKHITKGKLENIQIPLPPLATQKLIVAKLDETFAQIDDAIDATQANIDQTDELTKSVLDKVFEEGEWEKKKLGEVCLLITKGTTPTTYGYRFLDKGITFVKVENMKNGRINHNSIEKFIGQDAYDSQKRSQLEEGDILFSIAGTIGNTAIVKKEDLPANINQAIAIIRGFSENATSEFMKIILSSQVTELLKNKARGGALQNISLNDIKEFEIPFPPLIKQKEIVKYLDQAFAQSSQLKEQYQKKLVELKELKASVLQGAFDPNEEE